MDNGRFTFWVAVVGAVVVTMLVGLLVALPSLRLGGLMLALATLALAFVGGPPRVPARRRPQRVERLVRPRPAYGPVDLADDRTLFVVLLVLVSWWWPGGQPEPFGDGARRPGPAVLAVAARHRGSTRPA